MKKILFFASALAGLFLASSCQRESLESGVTGNVVSYTIQVPGALNTKAIGTDVSAVNELVYAVYRTEATEAGDFTKAETKLFQKTATITDGIATVDFELVNNQNFRVLFWAQVSGNGVYNTDDLKKVTLSQTLTSNQEKYAAFSGADYIKSGDDITNRKITLVRPVAQLNIATTEASLSLEGQTEVVMTTTGVEVTGLSTSYNVAEALAGEAATTAFKYAAADVSDLSKTLEVNGTEYAYVAMNYVGFADQAGSNVKVNYTINTANVGTIANTIENVPVKANYRTNIIGNLITETSDYPITLEEEWGEEDILVEIWDGVTKNEPKVVDGKYIIKKASEFAWLEAPQVLSYDVELASNIDMGGNKFLGILSNGKSFDGAGHTLKNVKLYAVVGQSWSSLFVTGGGNGANSKINVKNLIIDGAHVVAVKGSNGNAAVIASYAEATLNIENVKVINSTVNGTQSIGALVGHVTGSGNAAIKNCEIDNVTLSTFDVPGDSGNIGGVVGRVTGKCTIENTSISNSVINAYVNDGEQARTVSKYVGNFYGSGAALTVTGGSIDNVTLNLLNDLAQTQSCLYTEYLGGWRTGGGSVSINGIGITKGQTNDDITINTPAELTTAISNAADGAVIPVSGNISTNSLSASGKSITIVGMSDDATINSASSRMETYGNITFQNVTIKLPTNNDYYGGQDAHNAQIVYDNCKFVGTATAINGTFVYNDCEFTNPDRYAAWVYNGNVTYNNCSFTGKDRAAKVYAEAGNAPVVTYNNCTFNAAQSVNKTAVEIDCTNQTSGTPYYVTIINPTINNMGVAEHYAVGADGICNLETSGQGLGIVNLDGKGYSVAHTAVQLQALAWAIKEDMGLTTVEVAAGTYSDDITLTVAAAGKTAKGNLVFKAEEGTTPVITGTVTLGYRNQGTGSAMWDCNITFDGIAFDHAADATHSLDVQDVKSLTLKNCKLIGDGEYGLTSARGNATGTSSIVGCTFENAGMQLLGNFATGLVIEGCTFNKSCINVQAGNGVTVQDCKFINKLTPANVDESFYLIRSNSTPITVKKCNINIDSDLSDVAAEQAKWGIFWNRGTTNWTVEDVAVTMTDSALEQTELEVTKCTSTGKINTTNLTVNGNVQ